LEHIVKALLEHKALVVVLILFLSCGCTLASYGCQRFGPEYGYLGNECKPDCKVLKRNAGWPLAYVYDRMGVSVMHSLGIEDEFRVLPFAIDLLLYGAVLSIVWTQLKRRALCRQQAT
jgi:hypothetical protein